MGTARSVQGERKYTGQASRASADESDITACVSQFAHVVPAYTCRIMERGIRIDIDLLCGSRVCAVIGNRLPPQASGRRPSQ